MKTLTAILAALTLSSCAYDDWGYGGYNSEAASNYTQLMIAQEQARAQVQAAYAAPRPIIYAPYGYGYYGY